MVIAGGHTVQDKEPKYGLVVLGFVDPARMLTKGGAQARRRAGADQAARFWRHHHRAQARAGSRPKDVAEVVGWMKRLNREASAAGGGIRPARRHGYHRFQPAGARLEMAHASGVGLRSDLQADLPSSAARGSTPKWAPSPAAHPITSIRYFEDQVQFDPGLDEAADMLLFDPQTSGGLLLAVPHHQLEKLLGRAGEINQADLGDRRSDF